MWTAEDRIGPVKEQLRAALCYRCDDRDAGDVYYRVAPAGLLNLHGVLRAHGFDSHLFNFSGRSRKDVAAQLKRLRPQLVGVSHFTYNPAASVQLFRIARALAPDAVLVAGGAQASFLDAELLTRAPAIHLVIRGEAEETLLRVARQVARGARDWRRSPGLSWRGRSGVERTRPAPLAVELDPLHPDERFEALDGVNPAEQLGFVVTSRGCAAACTFCSSPHFWRRRVRFRSVKRVVDEIVLLRRRVGLARFGVRDDTFTGNKARVAEFCDELSRRRVFLPWNCQSRVNLVDDERLIRMKKAGCEQIQFGVESASPRVLARLNKHIRLDQVREALAACRRAGIESSAYFITGVPGQSAADIAANRRLFDDWGLQDGIVAPLCYYPGASLFEEARRGGAIGAEIFFAARPTQLLVRRDDGARRQYEEMNALVEDRREGSQFTEAEIERHLQITDRCFSSLSDLARRREGEGDHVGARALRAEIRRRWPECPLAGGPRPRKRRDSATRGEFVQERPN